MASPLISVIMPAYNAEKFIAVAIDSVIVQTFLSWELIIVDDGSTDNTAVIVKEFEKKDDRIRYIGQQHGGQGKARNNGILHSQSEFVAFLDADDVWMPEKLDKQIALMRDNDVDLVFSDAYIFKNKPGEITKLNIKPGHYSGDDAVRQFLSSNHIPLLTALGKKSSIHKVNGFSERTDIHEDYDLWLRMLINGSSFLGINSPLAYYRVHAASSSAGEGKMLFFNINTLKSVATMWPAYKIPAEESIVRNIEEYLGTNNVNQWETASRLITIRNEFSENRVSFSFWKWVYKIFGKNIFRMLFHFKNS